LRIEQDGRRPYFRAYWNGKGAISVAAGGWAPGVHGWRPADREGARPEVLLAGPSILHYHLPDAAAFRAKYREAAGGPDDLSTGDPGRPVPPSRLEREAAALVREAGEDADLDERLEALYRELTVFEPAEVEMLDAAGLLFTPEVAHPPLPPGGRPSG
jgi:hypothetical protein